MTDEHDKIIALAAERDEARQTCREAQERATAEVLRRREAEEMVHTLADEVERLEDLVRGLQQEKFSLTRELDEAQTDVEELQDRTSELETRLQEAADDREIHIDPEWDVRALVLYSPPEVGQYVREIIECFPDGAFVLHGAKIVPALRWLAQRVREATEQESR